MKHGMKVSICGYIERIVNLVLVQGDDWGSFSPQISLLIYEITENNEKVFILLFIMFRTLICSILSLTNLVPDVCFIRRLCRWQWEDAGAILFFSGLFCPVTQNSLKFHHQGSLGVHDEPIPGHFDLPHYFSLGHNWRTHKMTWLHPTGSRVNSTVTSWCSTAFA